MTCADCHMPYQREGALKVKLTPRGSPLLNINRACQTCDKWSEDELKGRAETIQMRVFELRNRAMDATVALIGDLKAAKAGGAPEAELLEAQKHHRRAQFLLDFVEAENSTGFHAPEEAGRLPRFQSTKRGRGRSRCCRRVPRGSRAGDEWGVGDLRSRTASGPARCEAGRRAAVTPGFTEAAG